MPYQGGSRLPGEHSSRTAHLEVLQSPLVKMLVESFKKPTASEEYRDPGWVTLPEGGKPLKYIFGVDGSYQTVRSDTSPYSSIGFVKTALMKLDTHALSKLDKENPHPLMVQDILQDSVVYHATAFPLQNVWVPGMNNYHAIRKIVYESIKDKSSHMEGEVMETFKWIVYEKWSGKKKELPVFQCPHCHQNVATLPYDSEKGFCENCKNEIYITDMLGFHLDMGDDTAPEGIPSTYMTIHETLLLFTAIHYFWEHQRNLISQCLFVKDGPLSVRAQYSKLVEPIRRFLAYARDQGYPVHIIGQEKSGTFFDHLKFIERDAPANSMFLPQDHYIKGQIQHRPLDGAEYGKDTNYGAKVFLKIDDYTTMVLNVPFGDFTANPHPEDLIGLKNIVATIPQIISYRHEGGLIPIELAHGVVSLSTYPSARILKLFTDSCQNGTGSS
jgi:hypothetical protein